MSAEKETLRRVQDGLFHLTKGLTPFVEARMRKEHGERWLQYASRAQGSPPNSALDAYGLLKTMLDNWRDVFDEAFARNDKHRVRNFTSVSFEARNATSHLTIPLQDDEALRFLDAMHQLLRAVKASTSEVVELKRLYDEQRRSGIATAPTPATPTEPPQAKLELPPGPAFQTDTSKVLKSWIDVAPPHPDVLANRFKEAEFAADLFAVDAGHATEDYATPENFFRITFLTEGLKRVLTSALQRLSGAPGGDPVIGLQTAFGGGKTHTMLAVYHLAKTSDLKLLDGVAPLAEKAGVKNWKRPKVAVFVGSSKGTDVSLTLKDGPKVHTLWGYIAWRLAGDAGVKLIAEAEAARTSPGSELMVEVFKLAGPSVVLLDELVAFARQLPDERFEAFLSFMQSLTEAAKMSPGVLVVGSLPESDSEVGGEKGKAALLRLEKTFGRVQSPWMPASGDETYEIIRRRLFQALDSEGERARDETVKVFHDMYRKNSAEFPPEAREARYAELLRLSYPIHPELFDRLSKDWASLDKFQRTRGVLRFMANVVGVLWHSQTRDPLITPARVPIAHERVRASVLYPLDPAFSAVIDREVDGEGSLPMRMEANPSRRISQARAATRAARAVFLCTAPLAGQPNAGLTGQGLRLACAEPGDQLAIFGEALRELTERATYLYEEGGRYWFSTQPTLNREAENRAKAYQNHEVDAAIIDVLRDDARSKGSFHGVFAAPDDPTGVDEAKVLSLVILGPSTPHSGRAAQKSAATDAVTESLLRCRASQRRLRNTLIFVAADEALLATAREVMRKARAWGEIAGDKRLRDQLPSGQIRDAEEKAKSSRDAAAKAVRHAWSQILYPVKGEATAAGVAFDLEQSSITSKDRLAIPVGTYDKLGPKGDGTVRERLGPDALSLHLKPLWPQDRPNIPVSEIAEWFATYVYLPKIRDRVVLDTAIREAVAKLDPSFGYADSFDQAAGTYSGLIWAKAPPEVMPTTALLVHPDVAVDQLQRKDDPSLVVGGVSSNAGGMSVGGPQTATGSAGSTGSSTRPVQPHRFYGSVEIDIERPVKSFDAILNAVVMELQRTQGATVKLTLEVEAQAPNGFSDGDVGVVRDNARQLKFKAESTGFED
jgi:uncharacterized protein